MALPKRKTFIWIGAVLGALGPLLYYLSPAVQDYILGDGFYLWPTGFIIIFAYGNEGNFIEYLITAVSIAANIAFFAGLAGLLWFLLSKMRGAGNGSSGN